MTKLFKDFPEWIKMPLSERLEDLRQLLCTGPCGQSSHVATQREATDRTLRDAMAAVKALADAKETMAVAGKILEPRNGKGWAE